MKKILFSLTFIAGIITFVSCSDEQDSLNNNAAQESAATNLSTAKIYRADLGDYLEDFYGTTFNNGVSAYTSDADGSYVIQEVIVGSDTTARGYVVSDSLSLEPLYFADVDRVSDKVTFVDLSTEESETIDVSTDDIYLYNGYDFISIINKVNYGIANNINPVTVGNTEVSTDKFWGAVKDCGDSHWVESGATFLCVKECTVTKYRFWIGFKKAPKEEPGDCD